MSKKNHAALREKIALRNTMSCAASGHAFLQHQ